MPFSILLENIRKTLFSDIFLGVGGEGGTEKDQWLKWFNRYAAITDIGIWDISVNYPTLDFNFYGLTH